MIESKMAGEERPRNHSALSRVLTKTKSKIGKSSSSTKAEDLDGAIRQPRASIDSVVESLLGRRSSTDSAELDAPRGRSQAEKAILVENSSHEARRPDYGRSSSSLVTVESISEKKLPSPLESRPSHVGYLTTSSPLIHATTAEPTPSPILALAPSNKDVSRSRSPAGKFKNVFKSSPSRRATSPSPSPDRSPLEVGGGGGLGSIFTNKKADSRRASTTLDPQNTSSATATTVRPNTAKGRIPAFSINTASPPATPTTTITPPTPIIPIPDSSSQPSSPEATEAKKDFYAKPAAADADIVTSPSGLMISHRRSRSTPSSHPPSKLSNAVTAPLTPIDEPRSISGSTGFFSSAFSAAQNLATTLGNTITNNPLNPGDSKVRNSTHSIDSLKTGEEVRDGQGAQEEVISNFSGPLDKAEGGLPSQRPAVETLGFGELSLSHLGIAETNTTSQEKMAPKTINGTALTPSTDNVSGDRPSTPLKAEPAPIFESPKDEIAKQSTPTHGPAGRLNPGGPAVSATPYAEDVSLDQKPHSVYEQSISGDAPTPVATETEGDGSVRRSGSVRSKVGAVARRKRGSSAGTGGTIAAAIGATNAALGHHSAQVSVPRLTGFAVASKKRNRDFHLLFRSVPEDDYLIEDYSAAIQRDILMHGRLYVSEGHICFNANIFGWVTTSVISFDEVVSIEKKSTAMVFPNAIVISTLQRRNVFASFVSRDSTYDLLVGIWKISHPNLKSSANGITLDDSKGADKTVKGDDSESDGSSLEDDEDDEMYDEDEEYEDAGETNSMTGAKSSAENEVGDGDAKAGGRKVSNQTASGTNQAPSSVELKVDGSGPGSTGGQDFPGPATHAPTNCADQSSHYEKIIRDEVIAAPLGKLYNLLFGPASGAFMTRFLLDDQKVTELQFEDDKKGLTEESRTRNSSYIKPLNASIGPKQTKCIINENLDAFDLEKAVSVTVVTQTPDVPSGNVFSVKTRYCLSWAEGNSTRYQMTCGIEWTGKSWLKNPIEKGANDGQVSYAQALVDAMRSSINARPRAAMAGTKGRGKGRRRKGASDSHGHTGGRSSGTTDGSSDVSARKNASSWGPLEPIRGIVEPLFSIIRPILSGNLLLGGAVILILFLWFSSSWTRIPQAAKRESLFSQQTVREQTWRQEEAELWNWLEDRAGLSNIAIPRPTAKHYGTFQNSDSKSSDILSRLMDDSLGQREIEHAIDTTERKLQALKQVVAKRKGQPQGRNNKQEAAAAG